MILIKRLKSNNPAAMLNCYFPRVGIKNESYNVELTLFKSLIWDDTTESLFTAHTDWPKNWVSLDP